MSKSRKTVRKRRAEARAHARHRIAINAKVYAALWSAPADDVRSGRHPFVMCNYHAVKQAVEACQRAWTS